VVGPSASSSRRLRNCQVAPWEAGPFGVRASVEKPVMVYKWWRVEGGIGAGWEVVSNCGGQALGMCHGAPA